MDSMTIFISHFFMLCCVSSVTDTTDFYFPNEAMGIENKYFFNFALPPIISGPGAGADTEAGEGTGEGGRLKS